MLRHLMLIWFIVVAVICASLALAPGALAAPSPGPSFKCSGVILRQRTIVQGPQTVYLAGPNLRVDLSDKPLSCILKGPYVFFFNRSSKRLFRADAKSWKPAAVSRLLTVTGNDAESLKWRQGKSVLYLKQSCSDVQSVDGNANLVAVKGRLFPERASSFLYRFNGLDAAMDAASFGCPLRFLFHDPEQGWHKVIDTYQIEWKELDQKLFQVPTGFKLVKREEDLEDYSWIDAKF